MASGWRRYRAPKKNPPLCSAEGDTREKKFTFRSDVVLAIENPYDRWLES